MRKTGFLILLLLVLTLLSSCYNHKEGDNSLIIFHAGSLSVPVKKIVEEYAKENPEVKIFAESSGSLDAARKVTDLNKNCDILAVADFQVIDKLLVPDHASWNFVFASNSMVIAYTDKSRYSKEFNTHNWQKILKEEDVIIGRSNPDSDPCGYRAVFVFKLAEMYYKEENLSNTLINKENTVIRPKEVDLLALLETGNIDYLMIYKSVAIQHDLNYIELPDETNLSNPDLEELYNSVSMAVTGSKPGETAEITGSSILYSLTIPGNAPNPELALKFILFLIDADKGGKILEQQGMGVINYCDAKYLDKIPDEIQKLL